MATGRIIPRKRKEETDRTVLECIEKTWRLQAEFSCELVIGIQKIKQRKNQLTINSGEGELFKKNS